MRKEMFYKVVYGYGNVIHSKSRDAMKHCRNLGEDVMVYDSNGKLVSAARMTCTGKPERIHICND